MPLAPPPRETDQTVKPHDHEGIGDHDGVIRRISDEQIVPDAVPGTRRISSKAYRASSGKNGGMSVDLEALLLESGVDPRVHVTNPKFMGSVRFITADLRADQLLVGYDPLPDNYFHGEVWGAFNKGQQRRLQKLAVWFVEIKGVNLT